MAYTKTDRADAPMKRRNIRRRKKYVYSVQIRLLLSIIKMQTS